MKPIVIVGAGGFGREVLDLLRDINQDKPTWEILGFLDDKFELVGKILNDLPVLGTIGWLESQLVQPQVALGVGSSKARYHIVQRISQAVFPSLIHPNVVMSNYMEIGRGIIITAGNILTNQIRLGNFAMLNLACTIGHDTSIGNYVTVSPGVNISGNVHIAEGCELGTGSALIPGVHVGRWSVIGAGAVVVNDIPPNCTAIGVPARAIKFHESPG